MLLQDDINNASKWSDDSKLRFHPDKMACMRITLKDQGTIHNYTLKDKFLSNSNEEKDLGIIIDSKLSFEKYMQTKINKADSAMGIIRRTMDYLHCENFKLLFTALVRPHLDYANPVWSPSSKKHVQVLEIV